MRQRDAWDQAQLLAAEFLWWSGWLVLNTGLTCRLLDIAPMFGAIISLAALLVLLVALRFFVEGQLKRVQEAREEGGPEDGTGEDLPLRPS
jgi:membrane protein implicated in regulation of membrane protease activity